MTEIAVVALLAATGSANDPPFGVQQLPHSQHACRIIDRSPLEITVCVFQPGRYSVGGTTTNEEGLGRLFSKATGEYGKGIPVGVRAKPEEHFGVVWRVVELASTNGCRPAFDVRVSDVEWPKSLAFDTTEAVSGTTNSLQTVRIVYRQNDIQVELREGTQVQTRPVSLEQLRRFLQSLASLTRTIPVSISVAQDIAHQEVINVLDACEGVGLGNRSLAMDDK